MNIDQEELIRLQKKLSIQVEIPSVLEANLQEGDWICTMDIQYHGEQGFVAADLMQWQQESNMVVLNSYPVEVPYVPGFFAFREGPLLLNIVRDIQDQLQLSPTLLILDGHGIAHPRRFGLASWLGVKTSLPCIGVAKDSLLPYSGKLGEEVGSHLSILHEDQAVGIALRTQFGVKPIFVSPGHKISLTACANVIFQLRGPYRQIEPIRRADYAARAFARGEVLPHMRQLS